MTKTIYAVFTSPDFNYRGNNYNFKGVHLITKMYFKENREIIPNFGICIPVLNSIGVSNMCVITITKRISGEEVITEQYPSNFTHVTHYTISYELFFRLDIIRYLILEKELELSKLEIPKYFIEGAYQPEKVTKFKPSFTIFRFEDTTYFDLVVNFKNLDIQLSAGSGTKRGVFAPHELRLGIFIASLERKNSYFHVWNSFHNTSKETSQVNFDLSQSWVKIKEDYDKLVSAKKNSSPSNKDNLLNNTPSRSPQDQLVDEIPSSENSNSSLNSNQSITEQIFKRKYHSKSTLLPSFFNLKRSFYSSSINLSNTNFDSVNNFQNSTPKVNLDSNTINYFKYIKEIINNQNLSPVEAQNLIEDSWIDIINEKLNNPKYLTDRHSENIKYIIKEAEITLDSIIGLDLEEDKKKTLNNKNNLKKSNFITKFPFLIISNPDKLKLLIITYSIIITYWDRLSFTSLALHLANQILIYTYLTQEKINKKNNKASLTVFPTDKEIKYNNFDEFLTYWKIDKIKQAKLGAFFLDLFTNPPHDLIVREINPNFYHTKDMYKVDINENFLEEIKKNIVTFPFALPMICEPNKWSEKDYGGYLSNSKIKKSIITKSDFHKHKINLKSNLFKAINYLNSIKFSINSDLLNFLNNEGNYLKKENSIYADKSTILQENFSLKIADCFNNCNKPFYLTARADWRSRLYVQSFFINYQGNDLALALLQFWEGEKLTELGKKYLYIYGANLHNENNISKSTFSDRILWVQNNYDKIINCEKDLISSAENPFTFAAFCLTLKNVHNDPEFLVKLPVFLDATANGLQHIAALTKDLELGTQVNLTEISEDNKPHDLYTRLVDPVNKAVNKLGHENFNFFNLRFAEFNRKILKTSFMTIIYNVTIYGIVNQLLLKFDYLKDLKKNNFKSDNFINKVIAPYSTVEDYINAQLKLQINLKKKILENLKSSTDISKKESLSRSLDRDLCDLDFLKAKELSLQEEHQVNELTEKITNNLKKNKEGLGYIVPGINGKLVFLSISEIREIAKIINHQIFLLFPSLNYIYEYFLNISKLMTKLGIPISWVTPAGLNITQDYLKSKRISISTFNRGRTKKMVLKEITDKKDNLKQVEAIIPNIIHSLDATHLIILLLDAQKNGYSPILPVHDCFGCHPNNMKILEYNVKKLFILLYTQKKFLLNFHETILNTISNNNIKIYGNKNKYVIIENDKIEIPNLPKLGKLDLKNIINAKYMIN
jgi:DNA-dependent RNA polymerase